MQDFDGQNIKVDVNLLEKNIEQLLVQLTECRQENEALRSELSSLQNILTSFKLPGKLGSATAEAGSNLDGVFASAEKVQVKQKLVMMLQKIEMELRNSQTL
jgi:cell division septum initiation protein DivIVA